MKTIVVLILALVAVSAPARADGVARAAAKARAAGRLKAAPAPHVGMRAWNECITLPETPENLRAECIVCIQGNAKEPTHFDSGAPAGQRCNTDASGK